MKFRKEPKNGALMVTTLIQAISEFWGVKILLQEHVEAETATYTEYNK